MSRVFLKDLQRGDSVDETYLVETANFKQARNGKVFIQMVLRDSTAAVKAIRWESSRNEFHQIERQPFLHVGGRVEEFQGSLQIIVDECNPLSPKEARVDPADFLPTSRYPIPEMAKALNEIIESIEDVGVRKLVNAVLDRPGVREGLERAPAGKSMHHARIGGLLEHVLSLARLGQMVADHFSWLNRSLLLAGIVLHDIGKVEELSYEAGFSYTDEGQLVGHIPMAVTWIDEAAKKVPEADSDRVIELKHLITSHHGKLEYGSPREPMTGEALAIHFLDNLDARLTTYIDSFDALGTKNPKEGLWGEYNHMIGTRLYYPRGLSQRSEDSKQPKKEPGELF